MSSPLRAARRIAGALAVLASTTPLSAQTYGNALIDRGALDTFTNFVLVATTPFDIGPIPRVLSSFSVWGGSGAVGPTNIGREIRPLLLRETAPLQYTVLASGALRTVAAGVNDWDFALESGSALITGSDVRFGWWNGAAGGAVQFDGSGPEVNFSLGGLVAPGPSAGDFVGGAGVVSRTYSIQWTTERFVGGPTPVPEPSTAVLALLGVSLLLVVRRRRGVA